MFAEKITGSFLKHYGVGHDKGGHSGRYPFGSGDAPYQHGGDFLSRVEELKKSGMSEKDIAASMNLHSTTELRIIMSKAKEEERSRKVETAKNLRDQGYSLNKIAEKMGFENDSSVRSLLNAKSEARMNQAKATVEILKKEIASKGMIDVGSGIERELGVSREKLNQALYMLQMEGYEVYGGGVPQINNPGKQINLKVLCPPGTEHKEIYNFDNVNSISDYISYDGGDSYRKSFEYPSSIDSKRIHINYAEEGGVDKDGLIEIRRGVKDLSLGESHYAQVRIMVDGSHYLKGMAVYSDDLPDGVDVVFNTNKKLGTPMCGPKDNSVLKPIKSDPNNPFGALIKEHGGQSYYDDPNGQFVDPITGKKQSLSAINKTREEGDWGSWSKELPSQFLAKQNMALINKQLELTKANRKDEFDEICALTNPTVKKALLQSFADDCDASAVHLQAASLPRQKYQVIIPVPSLKDNEIYAPNFRDGEQVALVRYPHGGTFEIPLLTVNNKHADAQKVMGTNALDAVGINAKVAERLSGADFDGDTAMVIPCSNGVKITSTKPLERLEGFDPKFEYGGKPKGTYKAMNNTQIEMGKISNLITDMTLKGANTDELADAVRHSMVVIDAEKHGLDYRQSEADHNIAALRKKYQGEVGADGKYHEGAGTLLSRAKSPATVLKRKGSPIIDPETGKVSYKEVVEEYVGKDGKTHVRTQDSTKMAEASDARALLSKNPNPKEVAYADYANYMKNLGNEARRVMMNTGKIAYSPSAKKTYQNEVDSLDAKLMVALMNAPKERQAQMAANSVVKAKKQENPNMTKEEVKKAGQQALTEARNRLGARKTKVEITDKEWEAIQSGAISEHKLVQILNNADMDSVRQRATPRSNNKQLNDAKINRIQMMKNSGYTNSQIAEELDISTSTISKYLKV